jgi:hypothetical protein
MAKDVLFLSGKHRAVCTGPDGRVDWVDEGHNTIMLTGLSNVLRAGFMAGTQVASWFMGLIANADFDEITVDDTPSSHAGWDEFTDYSGATRPQWSPLSESSGILLNTSPVQFTFASAGTVRGYFLVSDSTKGGTSGTLWCAGPLSTARTVRAGASLTVTYSVRAAGGT